MASDRLSQLQEKTRYSPAEVEQAIFASWEEGGYFHPEATGSADKNFSVAIPPPNITGSLHMGHALNGSIQDCLVRMRRMQGKNALWILGTDHASIATHAVVEKKLIAEGSSRREIGRDAFEARTWEWKQEYGSTIVEQYKRLGASCDYGRERFTLDEGYAKAVYVVFKRLFDKGFIYKDNYMVNWDPAEGTAISDLEVEHKDVEDELYEISYPLASGEGSVTVATVRPETLFADTAVAVNPQDDRYKSLIGQKVKLPLTDRELVVIADDHVETDFGTGVLKITPGHDPNDFEIGRKHGLEEILCIGEDGKLNENAGEFSGMPVGEARSAVVDALKEAGLLVSTEPYTHSVGHSARSGVPVEPLISEQWFCHMEELAGPAIDVVKSGKVNITPERWQRVYMDWMENIRPWCISRQLWWGHRLPVWYCDDCGEVHVEIEAPDACVKCGGALTQEEDVLDTWFSSALWPFATLGWPDKTPEMAAFYPTDFLTTAREILFLWVARMVMMSLEFVGEVPFDDVYVHSVILASDGRRMSKSLGTGIDPLKAIDEYGADALRFGLLAMTSTQDVRYSEEKVGQGRDFANKLWNASRLVLLNVDDVKSAPQSETLEDRWVVSRLQDVIKRVTSEGFDKYKFSQAVLDLYNFFWHDFCDWYLEAAKPRLYDDNLRPQVSANLLYVLGEILALMHPVMPFVTEEIYSLMPESAKSSKQLVIRAYPEPVDSLEDSGATEQFELLMALVQTLRRFREQAGVSMSIELEGALTTEDALLAQVFSHNKVLVERLAKAKLSDESDQFEPVATLSVPGGSILIRASEHVDGEELRQRLQKRRDHLVSEIERAKKKLGNESFVNKAPGDVVIKEKETMARCEAELSDVEATIG